jgi:hypothetical protein
MQVGRWYISTNQVAPFRREAGMPASNAFSRCSIRVSYSAVPSGRRTRRPRRDDVSSGTADMSSVALLELPIAGGELPVGFVAHAR